MKWKVGFIVGLVIAAITLVFIFSPFGLEFLSGGDNYDIIYGAVIYGPISAVFFGVIGFIGVVVIWSLWEKEKLKKDSS